MGKISWIRVQPKKLLCCQLNGKHTCSCCKFKFCETCFVNLSIRTIPIEGCFVAGGITRSLKPICFCCISFATFVKDEGI